MKKLILITALLFGLSTVHGQTAVRTKHFNLEKGVAIQGYDPIAYFTQSKAVKGSKDISTLVDGVTYYFSLQTNKDLFLKDPKKFEPQYGGWCAYAMGATNEKVVIDPATFKIVGGKLYLFYHSWTNNTLNKWNADESNLKTKADKNWLAIFK
jgi:YHS domain-containing protein